MSESLLTNLRFIQGARVAPKEKQNKDSALRELQELQKQRNKAQTSEAFQLATANKHKSWARRYLRKLRLGFA